MCCWCLFRQSRCTKITKLALCSFFVYNNAVIFAGVCLVNLVASQPGNGSRVEDTTWASVMQKRLQHIQLPPGGLWLCQSFWNFNIWVARWKLLSAALHTSLLATDRACLFCHHRAQVRLLLCLDVVRLYLAIWTQWHITTWHLHTKKTRRCWCEAGTATKTGMCLSHTSFNIVYTKIQPFITFQKLHDASVPSVCKQQLHKNNGTVPPYRVWRYVGTVALLCFLKLCDVFDVALYQTYADTSYHFATSALTFRNAVLTSFLYALLSIVYFIETCRCGKQAHRQGRQVEKSLSARSGGLTHASFVQTCGISRTDMWYIIMCVMSVLVSRLCADHIFVATCAPGTWHDCI